MNLKNHLESLPKRFDGYKVKEYGKWKIGRAEAKDFLLQSNKETIDAVINDVFGVIFDTQFADGFVGFSNDEWEAIRRFLPLLSSAISRRLTLSTEGSDITSAIKE